MLKIYFLMAIVMLNASFIPSFPSLKHKIFYSCQNGKNIPPRLKKNSIKICKQKFCRMTNICNNLELKTEVRKKIFESGLKGE